MLIKYNLTCDFIKLVDNQSLNSLCCHILELFANTVLLWGTVNDLLLPSLTWRKKSQTKQILSLKVSYTNFLVRTYSHVFGEVVNGQVYTRYTGHNNQLGLVYQYIYPQSYFVELCANQQVLILICNRNKNLYSPPLRSPVTQLGSKAIT